MVLSIIIPSFNTAKITQNCLDSIYESMTKTPAGCPELDYEIIVVDNASTDGSVTMLREYQKTHPHLKLIENKTNEGYVKANNEAVKQAQGEYILFLNSDIIVLNEAIPQLLSYYQHHEDTIQFLGGKLLNKNGSPQASAGPFFSLPVIFAFLFLRGDYWGLTRYSPDTVKKVGWVSGACILTKKHYFEALSGFDEGIFMYMDEIDLLYRAHQRHFATYFYPQARFIHLGSASSQGKTFPILQVYKGYLYFYKKHSSPAALFLLKTMLELKALVGFLIGKMVRNDYLITTYEKALKLVQMD